MEFIDSSNSGFRFLLALVLFSQHTSKARTSWPYFSYALVYHGPAQLLDVLLMIEIL